MREFQGQRSIFEYVESRNPILDNIRQNLWSFSVLCQAQTNPEFLKCAMMQSHNWAKYIENLHKFWTNELETILQKNSSFNVLKHF